MSVAQALIENEAVAEGTLRDAARGLSSRPYLAELVLTPLPQT